MAEAPPPAPRAHSRPSAAAILDDYANVVGLPPLEPPVDYDPQGTRILWHVRNLINHAHRERLPPVAAVHLSRYDAWRASNRIKAFSRDISSTGAVPAWAEWDAPPADRFYGVEIVADDTVPTGRIRIYREGGCEDYTMDVTEGG